MRESARVTSHVEEFRPGYPRYAALLSTHPSFQNFRRFTRTRLRLLLLKQDEISVLEETLDRIDTTEECELFLGCQRRDANPARREILQQLKTALAEYDSIVDQNHRILSLPESNERDVQSLKNWIEGTSCLTRQESAYLENCNDLMNLSGPADNAITRIESLVENAIFWVDYIIRRWRLRWSNARFTKVSSDGNIFILGPWLRSISRSITTWLATLALLIPVIVLNSISGSAGRLATIVLSSGIFLSLVSLFTKATTVDIFITGASYAAVLVVFTTAGSNQSNNCNC